MSRGDFWEQHPLAFAFQDVWDRLQYEPRGRDDTMDRAQWLAVTNAIEKDYEVYLRRWAREQMGEAPEL